jgi:hypothetical protein
VGCATVQSRLILAFIEAFTGLLVRGELLRRLPLAGNFAQTFVASSANAAGDRKIVAIQKRKLLAEIWTSRAGSLAKTCPAMPFREIGMLAYPVLTVTMKGRRGRR